MSADGARTRVIVVGGGFAGVACARKLASGHDVAVTLIDRNDYHQFQPLLYQVATCQLAAGSTSRIPWRKVAEHAHLEFKQADVTSIDPLARAVTTAAGETLTGDYLVLAAGSQPFFFKTPGAREHAFPLYSLDDARRLRAQDPRPRSTTPTATRRSSRRARSNSWSLAAARPVSRWPARSPR